MTMQHVVQPTGDSIMANKVSSINEYRERLQALSKPVISIEGLDFYYGKQQVLDNISLKLSEHKVTALIGASGSGKSTLLRTLNLIYRMYSNQRAKGHIYFKSKNILTHDIDMNELRAKIGMVFQKPTPFPMSIFENIAFAIKLHENLTKLELKERVESALHQAALWDEVKGRLKSPATSLSGGQQQRLCIARTIATQPEVLLLDEPTSALDPVSTTKIETLIAKLKSHISIVMVTHNLQQAKRIADQTAYMESGQIIEFARTEQLFKTPVDARTRAYIESYADQLH